MTVLIRSQGGQRSCTLLSNKNKRDSEGDLKQTIIDALKGLSIKIELKITDVIEASLSVDDDGDSTASQSQVNDGLNGVLSPKLEADISKKLAEVILDDYRPPRSSSLNETPTEPIPTAGDTSNGHVASDANQKPIPGIPAATGPELAEKPKQLSFAPLQALRKQRMPRVNAVSPCENKPAVEALQQAQPAVGQSETELEQSLWSARVEKFKQIKVKVDQEPQKPQQNKLLRGELALGKTIQTILAYKDAEDTYVAYNASRILEITEKLCEFTPEIEQEPRLFSVQVSDIVVAKSNEDEAWYRGIVTKFEGSSAEVNFFDWGMSETIQMNNIRGLTRPELSIYEVPACAVKVGLMNVDELPDDREFEIHVESYDEFQDTYQVSMVL